MTRRNLLNPVFKLSLTRWITEIVELAKQSIDSNERFFEGNLNPLSFDVYRNLRNAFSAG